MDRETFATRFREAAAACRSFSEPFLVEVLPLAVRFRLRLNASYDGNPLDAGELVFPEDSGPERARQLRHCSEEDVIGTLWRAELVPEWVNLNVVGVAPTATIIEILACGRFTANDELLYHRHEGLPPFHVLGPSLPLHWAEGQRFSIYCRSTCASPDELDAMRPHAAKAWSLELEGPMATDETLLVLPDMPNLEILELRDSSLHGPGLSALARCPRLRILRVHGVAGDFDVSKAPKLKRLEEVTISGLPPQVCRIDTWAARLGSLDTLSLGAEGELHLEGVFPKKLGQLTLAGTRITGEPRFPKRTKRLSVHLTRQPLDALAALLAPLAEVASLSLSRTPVGDDFVAKRLAQWTGVRYLDVVETAVSEDFLQDVALAQPALKIYPPPRLSKITPQQVARKVELQLQQSLRFTNFHGIEPRNLRNALVEPHPVMVTPGDDESPQRLMWAVLREADGHLVLFDPHNGLWVVATHDSKGWIESMAASTLDGALRPF